MHVDVHVHVYDMCMCECLCVAAGACEGQGAVWREQDDSSKASQAAEDVCPGGVCRSPSSSSGLQRTQPSRDGKDTSE